MFLPMNTKCPFCHQNTLIKYGRKNSRQRYKCSACHKFLHTQTA
ncbi:transposase-like zinc-binding domain-containing protein [Neisseria dentiae]